MLKVIPITVIYVKLAIFSSASPIITVEDECIEWQVNYGYQKFHEFLIKIQKNNQKCHLLYLQFMIKRQLSFKYHILQSHIHTNPYLEAYKP